ncbi:phage portal protein [Escherichia coli]|nr:phage portal protein [Escherichia coli]
MKTSTIPTLLGPDGMTSLREYAGYHGGGSGFGGQLRAWNPPGESVDAALLPNFTRGNARADDLVRNNGYAANAIQLHQDHIVGSFFRLSHRPSWRYLGIGEEEARAFSREVEAAWKEFAEDDCCCIDVERKRTFTMMIREGVAMHAFNGELFVQATWDTSSSRLFRTQFRMVSPKRISNPNNTGDSRNCRAGVQINDSGAALGYYVSEDGYHGWMPQKWTWIPRELPGGRASFIHVFEPVEDGQTRGANVFYSVMEQMKMLDTLQNTQLQSAIVKAMYAATIESELDTQSAMDFILGANSQEQRERLTGWIGEIAAYYAAAPVRLGGAKVPHLMPGDSLNLQTAQDTDNGYSVFEQSLLRYIAAGLGVSYEQLSRNYAQMSYSTARASANESWAHFMGRRKFVASRQASQMFLCWLEEAIVRRVVTLPSKARFSFQEARSAWGNCDWIGSGRMAIDGLKEVQEAVMLIEAGLSTYEKECAKRGDDYQEIFAQQVRETMERRAAGLKPPARAAAALNPGCDNQQRRRRVTAELRNLPHIASMAFNEPLMLEPAYARVFFVRLQASLGSAA